MLRISRPRTRAPGPSHTDTGKGGPPDIAAALRRIRQDRGYSLETLARLSGVSRAMLGQIETGKSAPTITLLWKVATALGVSLPDLLDSEKPSRTFIVRRSKLRSTTLSEGKVEVVGYSLPGRPLPFEATQLRLAAGHTEVFPPLGTQVLALLIVNAGSVSVHVDGKAPEALDADDAILFEAGHPHEISNDGSEDALLYLIVASQWHGRVA